MQFSRVAAEGPCAPAGLPATATKSANKPGPMKVADEKLKSVLGITDVHTVAKSHNLAVVDSTLA